MSHSRPPTFCGLLRHVLRKLLQARHYGLWALVGLVLVALNVPFGWGGALVCIFMGARLGQPAWYHLAALCYLLSWLMLAAGIALAGPRTVRTFRAEIPRAWRAWRRCRRRMARLAGS